MPISKKKPSVLVRVVRPFAGVRRAEHEDANREREAALAQHQFAPARGVIQRVPACRQRGQGPGFLPAQADITDRKDPPAANRGQAGLVLRGEPRTWSKFFGGLKMELAVVHASADFILLLPR